MPMLTHNSRRFVRTLDYTYPERRTPRSGVRERIEVVPTSLRGGWKAPRSDRR